MSLQETDREAEAVAKAPRVKLADIEAAIEEQYFMVASSGLNLPLKITPKGHRGHPLDILTLCFLVMKNGFTVIGKSAPAAPENFDENLGRKFAYEDAVRQLWPLMGFSLRDKLSQPR